MAWEKIVQLVAVSACPECGNRGFDVEPGYDMRDEDAMVHCEKCGHVCHILKFMRRVNSGTPPAGPEES
jgi:hypothetical protein